MGPEHRRSEAPSRAGLRSLAGALYFASALLLAVPFIDLGTNVWPIRAGDIAWRYGTVGLLSGFLLTPLLGLCIAAVVAAGLAQHRALRALGILSALGAAALLGVTVLFTLDTIQFRVQVPSEGRASYQIGALRAWGKNLVVVAALVWLAVGASRAARALEAGQGR